MMKFDQSGFSEKFQKTLGPVKAQKPPRAHIMVHGPDEEGGKPLKTHKNAKSLDKSTVSSRNSPDVSPQRCPRCQLAEERSKRASKLKSALGKENIESSRNLLCSSHKPKLSQRGGAGVPVSLSADLKHFNLKENNHLSANLSQTSLG